MFLLSTTPPRPSKHPHYTWIQKRGWLLTCSSVHLVSSYTIILVHIWSILCSEELYWELVYNLTLLAKKRQQIFVQCCSTLRNKKIITRLIGNRPFWTTKLIKLECPSMWFNGRNSEVRHVSNVDSIQGWYNNWTCIKKSLLTLLLCHKNHINTEFVINLWLDSEITWIIPNQLQQSNGSK